MFGTTPRAEIQRAPVKKLLSINQKHTCHCFILFRVISEIRIDKLITYNRKRNSP